MSCAVSTQPQHWLQASGDPAAKAAARDEFINRLQQEQAEQQARLEALKAVSTFQTQYDVALACNARTAGSPGRPQQAVYI